MTVRLDRLREVPVFKQIALVAAIAVASLSTPAFAGSAKPTFQLKRVPMGPRPDRYLYERVYDKQSDHRPRSLTGEAREPRKWRVVQRWAGPHYIGPVWMRDRERE